MFVLTWLYEAFTNLIGLILPVFGKARESKAVGAFVRWTVHFLLIASVLVGLHFLNQFLGLDKKLPGQKELLRKNWLPILFLLVYVLCWLGWALWKLLAAEEELPEFPDIQSAWDDALKALEKAGIDVREVPLFLVLGRPEGALDTLFQAAHLKFVVKGAPGADAPVQVYATAEAAYVACTGASVLGRHATLLSGETQSGGEDLPSAVEDNEIERTLQFNKNVGGPIADVKHILDGARRLGRDLTRDERRRVRALMRKDRVQQAPIRNADETGRLTARFEHLCRLIVRDRFPYCPINGVLLLVPFAATDGDQDALDTGATCQYDLATLRRTLQVNAPTLALLCDLETAPGFSEFVDRFPEKQRLQRVGQRCPLVPALPEDAGRARAETDMLTGLADWLCGTVVPGWVYKHFELEVPGRSDQHTAVRGNIRLFQFMHDLRQRQRRLGRLLSQAVVAKEGEPLLFGGCYLGATGSDPNRDQAFVAGVFRRLSDEENNVSWTVGALDEEASYGRRIGLFHTAVAVLVVAELALLGLGFFRSGK